jgi:hypothetical protein
VRKERTSLTEAITELKDWMEIEQGQILVHGEGQRYKILEL